MSAPLRKMGPQIRDLGTKFISARNYRSTRHVRSKVDTAKEVPEQGYKMFLGPAKYFLSGNLAALGVTCWMQYMTHGRVVHLLGIPISKTV
ncbi:hypothetical protein MKX03_024408 [Papaver bracteatum]|nr:hypothetical protein MKX03_024408 [Papaver bracteatum]